MTEPPRRDDRESIDELLRGIVQQGAGTEARPLPEGLPRRVRWVLLAVLIGFVVLLLRRPSPSG